MFIFAFELLKRGVRRHAQNQLLKPNLCMVATQPWEAEAGGPGVQGKHGLHSKTLFQTDKEKE
jgi:hypothetical protein